MGKIVRGISIIISIFFIFVSCSRNIFYNTSIPQKGTYQKIEYSDGSISVDPNDTNTINKYSLTENFTITNIENNKRFYDITVKSDSIYIVLDSKNNVIDSFYIGYQVISLKTKNIKISKKIKKGQQYTLTLIPNVMFLGHPNTILSHRGLYVFTKGMYVPVVSTAKIIYTTPNLDGLHYKSNKQSPNKHQINK